MIFALFLTFAAQSIRMRKLLIVFKPHLNTLILYVEMGK